MFTLSSQTVVSIKQDNIREIYIYMICIYNICETVKPNLEVLSLPWEISFSLGQISAQMASSLAGGHITHRMSLGAPPTGVSSQATGEAATTWTFQEPDKAVQRHSGTFKRACG